MNNSSISLNMRYKRPWAFWSTVSLLALFLLLLVVRVSAPYAVKWGAVSWLESQDLQASIIDIELQLFDGHASLSGLHVSNQAGRGISLDSVDVYWNWSHLFQRQLAIEKLAIGALKLDVSLFDNGDINLGGIQLPSASAESAPAEQVSDAGPGWDIIINELLLSDLAVCVDTHGPGLVLAEQSCIELDQLSWTGEIAVLASQKADASAATPISVNGEIDLADTRACLKRFESNQVVTLDYCSMFGTISWSGDVSMNQPGTIVSADVLALNVKGSFKVEQINVQNNVLDRALLKIGSLSISEIRLMTLDDISISKLNINELTALQRAKPQSEADAQLIAFDSMVIEPIHLSKLDTLTVDTITFDNVSAYFQTYPDGRNDIHAWTPQSKEKPVTEETKQSRPFNYSLAQFNFNSSRHIVFKDTSMKVPFTLDIHDIDLSFTAIDSSKPDQDSQLALKLGIDKHGSLDLNAQLKPLAKRPSVKGKGQITGFDLRLLAPLTKQYIGHNIKSGQLDADLIIEVDEGIIDSSTALTLHKFELKTLDKSEAERLNSEFGFPLNSTLSLLRDRDNTIRLEIPVTGDIDKPDFDPRDAVVKASSKAITTAVLHYYTPFGLVFAADALLNLATALSFEPLIFDAGSAELTSTHNEQIDNLARLMQDRPGVYLTLCGTGNTADHDILFPKPGQAQDNKSDNTALPLEQLTRIHELAESRSSAVKTRLIEKHSIASSRLIECSPEFIAEGIAGVEISI